MAKVPNRPRDGETLTPYKGKGKGNKGAWSPGKGAWGKGGKGAYGLEDDWSEGFSGYTYGYYGDIEALSLSQEWQTPTPRKTFKPSPTSPERGQSSVRREVLHQNQHQQV